MFACVRTCVRACAQMWEDAACYATWFSGAVECIHGIQMLPFTPISQDLLPASWVRTQYPIVAEALSHAGVGEDWIAQIFMDHAIIDADAAWHQVTTNLTEAWADGSGDSHVNTLYWVSTRPAPR